MPDIVVTISAATERKQASRTIVRRQHGATEIEAITDFIYRTEKEVSDCILSVIPADIPDTPAAPGILSSLAHQIPLLAALGPTSLATALAAATRVEVPRGASLFLAGDPADGIYIQAMGLAAVQLPHPAGRTLTLSLTRPGDLLGEIAAFDGGPRTASVTAITPAAFYHLPQTVTDRQILAQPEACLAAIRLLCARLRRATTSQERGALPVTSRLAAALLLLHAEAGRQTGHPQIITQDLLASMIGAGREAVNRGIGALRKSGAIGYRRGEVRILDPHALAAQLDPLAD